MLSLNLPICNFGTSYASLALRGQGVKVALRDLMDGDLRKVGRGG